MVRTGVGCVLRQDHECSLPRSWSLDCKSRFFVFLVAPLFRSGGGWRRPKLYRDPAAGAVVESALMPWNGRHDVLIDRFDARAVLDMVPLSPKVGG